MKLQDIIKLQKTLSPKLDTLCRSPIASSHEEANLWENNHEVYLREKTKKISPLPESLQKEVDQTFLESRNFYVNHIKCWYETSFFSLNQSIIMEKFENGMITKEQMLLSFDELDGMNFQDIDDTDRVNFFVTAQPVSK